MNRPGKHDGWVRDSIDPVTVTRLRAINELTEIPFGRIIDQAVMVLWQVTAMDDIAPHQDESVRDWWDEEFD